MSWRSCLQEVLELDFVRKHLVAYDQHLRTNVRKDQRSSFMASVQAHLPDSAQVGWSLEGLRLLLPMHRHTFLFAVSLWHSTWPCLQCPSSRASMGHSLNCLAVSAAAAALVASHAFCVPSCQQGPSCACLLHQGMRLDHLSGLPERSDTRLGAG